ncbi:MAG: hypothetical protein JJT78_07470 [Leptospira sp.]|nr:hypothetical protein [Leptospira sp.]
MAVNGGNFNEDEFDDLEPVLDEDSFSFDLEPPELDEVGLDSMVASAGDEYPEESELSDNVDLDLDSDLSVMNEEPNSDDAFGSNDINDMDDSIEFGDASHLTENNASESDFDLNLDMDLDLELDDEDPGIDKKIDEIVNDEKSNVGDESSTQEDEDEFDFDDLSEEDEPITLSLDELENITNTIDPENIETVESNESDSSDIPKLSTGSEQSGIADDKVVDDLDFDVPELDDDSEDFEESTENHSLDVNSDSNFSDEELDEILGTDLFEEEEDLSDEPIALSMDEMENILSDEEDTEGDSSDLDPESFDLDMDTPPADNSVKDEIEFEAIESTDESSESAEPTDDFDPMESDTLFDDDDIADEPITLSMDELSAITGEEDSADDSEIESESESDDIDFESKSDAESDDDFDFDLSEESGFGIDDSDSETTSKDSETEDSISEDSFSEDSFSELPEPDDTVDFEEFTLGDEDVTSEDTKLLSESEEEDENLTLSDEELGNILGADDELPASDLFDSDDEISLLPEEEDDHSDLDSGVVSDLTDIDTLEDELDEETDKELHEDSDEEFASEQLEQDEEDHSDEPITLSSEELNDIIGELPPGEDLETMDQVFEEEIIEPEEDLGFDEEKTPSLDLNADSEPELIDLDEFANDGELSPLEELRSAPKEDAIEPPKEEDVTSEASVEESPSTGADDLSPEDKKKVLTYLDNLLGNLPDDLIKEFSKSNYFELYKKMMKEIGL